MNTTRRTRLAADIAIGYAADAAGHGVAFASLATGTSVSVVRLTFTATPMPLLEGREVGYAAIAALTHHLKQRGFGRVRVRLGDLGTAAELNGEHSPPNALGMAYVRIRCALHGLGIARLEPSDAADVRDLMMRARAEVNLHVAA